MSNEDLYRRIKKWKIIWRLSTEKYIGECGEVYWKYIGDPQYLAKGGRTFGREKRILVCHLFILIFDTRKVLVGPESGQGNLVTD